MCNSTQFIFTTWVLICFRMRLHCNYLRNWNECRSEIAILLAPEYLHVPNRVFPAVCSVYSEFRFGVLIEETVVINSGQLMISLLLTY